MSAVRTTDFFPNFFALSEWFIRDLNKSKLTTHIRQGAVQDCSARPKALIQVILCSDHFHIEISMGERLQILFVWTFHGQYRQLIEHIRQWSHRYSVDFQYSERKHASA